MDCLVELDRDALLELARRALEQVKLGRQRSAEEFIRQHERSATAYESRSWLGRVVSSEPKWPPQEFARVGSVIVKTPWRRQVIEHGQEVEKIAEECVAACEMEGAKRILLSATACKKLQKWAGPLKPERRS